MPMNAVFILADYRRSYRVEPSTGKVEQLADFPVPAEEWRFIPADAPGTICDNARKVLTKHLAAADKAREEANGF